MNNILVLFLFIILLKEKKRGTLTLTSMDMGFDIDIKRTKEKIKMLKKIGPYFPEEYIASINKAIIITEKMLKIYETINFVQQKDNMYITESIPIKNHQERLSYIANTIQKDFAREEIKRLGYVADLILQVDRFNKMVNVLNSFTSNPDLLKDTNNMFKILEPLLGKDEKEMKKIKEMTKMMNILKALDQPKGNKEKKEYKENKKEENL